MNTGRTRQLAVAAALAIGLAIAGGTNPEAFVNLKSAGPLWWMPENDSNWSRFHDVWHDSGEELTEVAQPGAATSFPKDTWVTTRHGGYATNAYPNSACDYTAVPLEPYENGPGTPLCWYDGFVKTNRKHRGNQARGPQ